MASKMPVVLVNDYDNAIHVMGTMDFGMVLENQDDVMVYRWERMDEFWHFGNDEDDEYAICEGCGVKTTRTKMPFYTSIPLHKIDGFDGALTFCWECVEMVFKASGTDFLSGIMYSGIYGGDYKQIRKVW